MKITSLFLAAMFSIVTFITPASAATTTGGEEKPVKQMTEAEYTEAITLLKDRVEKLTEAKKNAKTKEEKKLLRKEIREVKNEANEMAQQRSGGGFGLYIGGGALIVILLLILLL
jgi:hypothetical protein